jgi:hypothetical protein
MKSYPSQSLFVPYILVLIAKFVGTLCHPVFSELQACNSVG